MSQNRCDIMFGDLLNVNIESYSFKNQTFNYDRIINLKLCLYDRYYDPIYSIRKQCLKCYMNHKNELEYPEQ